MNVWSYPRSHLRDRWVDHGSGQGLAEYAFILAVVAILAIGAAGFLGRQLDGELGVIGTAVKNVVPSPGPGATDTLQTTLHRAHVPAVSS